MALAISSVPVL